MYCFFVFFYLKENENFILSVLWMPSISSLLSVRVQRISRLLMNHFMQFFFKILKPTYDWWQAAQPCVNPQCPAYGFSLLQCISEYFESPVAVSMETREADVTGGYPEHAQICLFEPGSDADYVFSSILHNPSIFIN